MRYKAKKKWRDYTLIVKELTKSQIDDISFIENICLIGKDGNHIPLNMDAYRNLSGAADYFVWIIEEHGHLSVITFSGAVFKVDIEKKALVYERQNQW